jgi:hypothetical protein
MIDLRQEFENTLRDYGHYILLVRQNKKVVLPKSFDNNLGLQYGYTIEKHLCRSATAGVPQTLPRLPQSLIPGDTAVPAKMFYLKWDVRPQKDDIIVEPSWEKGKPVIDEYTMLYQISYPEPFRGDEGRIEYFRVACQMDPIESTLRLQTIAGKDYIIIDRGGTV